ncbi:Cruciform DNA binding protein [Taxawa tesnikishii (nom. ined.)]|nr:Cruciform DNA binding protein [Dothideales sp. JES 119]
MGSYTFRWPHQANEVFVTGTFDDWSKSVKLDRTGHAFEKTVPLPNDKKILYKFVVDGNWTHDHTLATEQDHSGITNNVLSPGDIKPASNSDYNTSSAAPASSSAEMAGRQPIDKEVEEHVPGGFPETPAFETPATEFGVNPFPATEGAGNPINLAPGEKVPEPSSFTKNTVGSTAYDDPELKAENIPRATEAGEAQLAVDPIPATGGTGNPIRLAPGEKVPQPSTYTGNTVDSNVRHDKASEREAQGGSMFDIPGLSGTMIPESSLPMGSSDGAADDTGFTINSAGPRTTTAELAGQVPLEPRGLPEVVSDSQEAAHADPEASSNREAVQEKSQVEDELRQKVPEAPATSESGAFGSSERGVTGAITGGVATAGAAIAGAANTARDRAVASLEQYQSAGPADGTAAPRGPEGVPEAVLESQERARAEPEASANPEAIQEKSAVEDELLQRVPEAPSTSESGVLGKSENGISGAVAGGAAAAGAAVAGAAYTAKDKAADVTSDPYSHLPDSVRSAINAMNSGGAAVPTATTAETSVPDVVTDSQRQAHEPLRQAVAEKSELESELLSKVKPSEEAGEPAPTETAALSPSAPFTAPLGRARSPGAESAYTPSPRAPEASGYPEMVAEKSALEAELLSQVKPSEESGEPAPSESAALSAVAPTKPTEPSAPAPAEPFSETAPVLPPVATTSALSPNSLESAEPLASSTELAEKPHPSLPSVAPGGLNAPAAADAQTPATKLGQLAAEPSPVPSRDVSPMTPARKSEGPVVTDGIASSSVPAASKPAEHQHPSKGPSTEPTLGHPASDRTSMSQQSTTSKDTEGKKKRKGLFGRIKDKLKS